MCLPPITNPMQQHGKLFNKDQHNGQNKMAAAFYDFFGGTAKSGHIPDRQLSFMVSLTIDGSRLERSPMEMARSLVS